MRFQIPGTTDHVRLFERVNQPDGYDIFDVGLETDVGIDSLAVGGSFATAKSWVKSKNEAAATKKEKDAKAKAVDEKLEAIQDAEFARILALSEEEGRPFQEVALREGYMRHSPGGVEHTPASDLPVCARAKANDPQLVA